MQWWQCGLLLEMPRGFLLMRSPSPPSSPSPPPSTTPLSTCCVSPTSANVSTKTRPRYARGSTEGVHSLAPEIALEACCSATRTWAFPHASQTDSRTATARACIVLRMLSWVMWPPVKGPRASWQDPPSQRWRSVNCQLHQLIYFSDLVASVSAYFLFHNPALRSGWSKNGPKVSQRPSELIRQKCDISEQEGSKAESSCVFIAFQVCSSFIFNVFLWHRWRKIYILPVDVIRFLYNHLEKKNKGIRQSRMGLFSL